MMYLRGDRRAGVIRRVALVCALALPAVSIALHRRNLSPTPGPVFINDSVRTQVRELEMKADSGHVLSGDEIAALISLSNYHWEPRPGQTGWPDFTIRDRAMTGLGMAHNSLWRGRIVAALAPHLRDSNSSCQAYAMTALSQLHATEYSPAVLPFLSDADPQLREVARQALIRLGYPPAADSQHPGAGPGSNR